MNTQLEKKFLSQVADYKKPLAKITEGYCLQAFKGGKKQLDIKQGKTYKYYDLASLTKVIFTATQLMNMTSKGQIQLNTKVTSILPWFPFQNTTLRQLLNHTAGFDAWKPFYKKTRDIKLVSDKWLEIEKCLMAESKRSNNVSVYSDLDFLALARLLETYKAEPLAQQWKALNTQLKTKMHFCENNKPRYQKHLYAPTEKCAWRKKVLRGEVHDDNTWALAGVSTHAGLFGGVEDVSNWALQLRKAWVLNKNTKAINAQSTNLFLKRSLPKKKGDWACGFMMPTKGSASCGDYFSNQSIGHTGFTGTSFWMDPKKDIFIVILSNRVYPTRKNNEFKKFRPFLHNCAMKVLNA